MPRKKTPTATSSPTMPAQASLPQAPSLGARPVLATVADVHLWNHARWGGPLVDGLNRRGRETVATLERAVRTAEREGCRAFAVAGDLFEGRRPEPALTAAVQRVFSSTEMAVILVPGNHDALDATTAGGNTSMAPLWKDATVVTESTWFQVGGLAILAIPFDARQPMAAWIGSEVERMAATRPGGEALLLTHVGVYDVEEAAPWQLKAKDAMPVQSMLNLLEAHGFATALVGNYHNYLQRSAGKGGPHVVQIGTLCPASFKDPEDKVGGVAFVAPGQKPWVNEIPGPRFLRALRADLGKFEGAVACSYYLRVVGEPFEPRLPYPPGVEYIDWIPPAVAGGESAAPVTLTQDPEEALRAACTEAPEGIRGPVEDLVMQAWRAGA
jgi:hypothetical protein